MKFWGFNDPLPVEKFMSKDLDEMCYSGLKTLARFYILAGQLP